MYVFLCNINGIDLICLVQYFILKNGVVYNEMV